MRRLQSSVWLAPSLLLALVVAPAQAQHLRGDFDLYGQVREGDQTRETEAPADLYGDLSLRGLPRGARIDTFFRLNRDFGLDEGAADFYAGFMEAPSVLPGVGLTLGRQFLGDVTGGVFVADAGKLTLDPGWPVSFTVFGGQPQYFEPTISSERLSQDEVIWGGSINTTRWRGGGITVGYLQHEREQKVLRQLASIAARQSFTSLPGLPSVYGSVAYDADHQNLDLATLGTDVFLGGPRLSLNVEGSYYKPQDHGERVTTDINRREDAIFEAFSVSDLVQLRGGLRYTFGRAVYTYADYSYQRYESTPGDHQNGHVASAGLVWLPGGDGLETVQLEYYLADSGGGNVNGGRASYENRAYERLIFRSEVDIAGIDSYRNRSDIAVHTLVGVGYALAPRLTCELDLEANRNQRFDHDIRFGLLLSYNFDWGRATSSGTEEQS